MEELVRRGFCVNIMGTKLGGYVAHVFQNEKPWKMWRSRAHSNPCDAILDVKNLIKESK